MCSTPVWGLRASGWQQVSTRAQAWLAVQGPAHCQPRGMRWLPVAGALPEPEQACTGLSALELLPLMAQLQAPE